MIAEQQTDEQLMALVQTGDQGALAALYDRYAKVVYGMALHKLQDAAEAQDITHDVFIGLWSKAHLFQVERGKPYSWLMTTAHHKIIDRLRRRQRAGKAYEQFAKEAPVATEERDGPQMAAQRAEEESQVRRALEVLPREQREVLVMAYYQGLSQSQISERLSIPLGTVKARTRLGMAKLRVALTAEGATP